MAAIGRTLKVFVLGQTSNALKTVELVNWTGLSFVGERKHLQAIRGRSELTEPGVYLLLSDSNDGAALSDIYIGETDDFTRRIVDHAQSKDWWDRFIVFVSKDKNLTKAHVKYLEQQLHALAKRSIANLKVRNSQEPGGASLPESDVSAMHEFLNNVQFVLETLGLSYFSSGTEVSKQDPEMVSSLESQEFYITLPKELSAGGEQLRSHMFVRNAVYFLKAGSYIRSDAQESFSKHDSYYNLWKQIVSSDVVQKGSLPGLLVITRDIEFRSPSSAGAVVRGRSTNGRIEWKRVSDGLPLAKCELGQDRGDQAA